MPSLRWIVPLAILTTVGLSCSTSNAELSDADRQVGPQPEALANASPTGADAEPIEIRPITGTSRLELAYFGAPDRGAVFVLSRREGTQWTPTHQLSSERAFGGTSHAEWGEDFHHPDVLISSDEPDHVELPQGLDAGLWQICSYDRPQLCGTVTLPSG